MEDAGRYTCVATNAAGEGQQHIQLHVHGNVISMSEQKNISIAFFFFLNILGSFSLNYSLKKQVFILVCVEKTLDSFFYIIVVIIAHITVFNFPVVR